MVARSRFRRGSCCQGKATKIVSDGTSTLGGSGSAGARRLRTIADLRIGDSASFIYGGEAEHAAVVSSFVRAGLEARQRVAYVYDQRTPQSVADLLGQHDVDVARAQSSGQLVFVPAKQLYTRGAEYGLEVALDKLHGMTALALADGWSALRLTTEMGWVLRENRGPDRLREYAGRLGAFFRGSAALGLCQFGLGQFSAEALLDVLLAHPVAVLGSEVVHNFYYSPEVEAGGRWRSEATLERWISNLKERKRAAQNLGDVLQLQRELMQNIGSGIVVMSRDGRIVQCNPFLERLLGLADDELNGRNLAEFFPNLGPDSFAQALERALAGEVVLSPDLAVELDGQERRWLIASLAPYRNDDGQVIGAIAVMSDITSRKQMEDAFRASEEQVRQTQKLEAVGRLAGGVAHDMNNALNAIIAFADLAAQEADANEGLLRADIGEIRTAASRAAGITRRLLAFSRRQAFQSQRVDLNPIVAGVETMLQRLLGDKITLVMALAAEAMQVDTDPAQLEQVIINLALNALDAMPDGGVLRIDTRGESVAQALQGAVEVIEPGTYAVLRVSDSGCGMSAETLAHAFEPFFTTKDMCRRSGLGLPVVYGIVKQSGGRIRIRSEIGQGTAVEIFLARVPSEAPTATRPGSTAGSETVLVVEDEELVRKVVARVLRRAGYRVHLAGETGQALAIFQELDGAVDLLLTDVVMPALGGKELAARVATRYPAVKILYMTGYTDDDQLRRGILDQGHALIMKPFSPDDLLRRIRSILGER